MLKRLCIMLFIWFSAGLYYAFVSETQVSALSLGMILFFALLFFILWMMELVFKRIKSNMNKNKATKSEGE